MKKGDTKYSTLFSTLNDTVELFIREVQKQRLQKMATEKWTVKDVLCHIVFWHNYYAQNYSSLATGVEPNIFTSKGGSTRNQEGVNMLNHKSQKDLITILKQAQSSLYKSIIIKKVPKMSYTNRNEYSTEEFLEIVTGHIHRHTIQVRRAKEVPD